MLFRRALSFVTLFAVCATLLRATPPPDDPREDSDGHEATTQPYVDYFALSYDEFAKSDAANRKISLYKLDNRLLSAAIMHETNRARASENRKPLKHLSELDEACMLHSKDMAAKQYLAHDEPEGGAHRTPGDRARAVGLKPILLAENIAIAFGIQYDGGRNAYPLSQWGRKGLSYKPNGPPIPLHTYQSFAQALVKSWLDSPNHRENIMIPDAQFIGSACVPQPQVEDENTNAFHRFYCGQLFYTPSKLDRKKNESTDEHR